VARSGKLSGSFQHNYSDKRKQCQGVFCQKNFYALTRLWAIVPLAVEKMTHGRAQRVVRPDQTKRRHGLIPNGSKVLRLLGERAAKALSPGRQIAGGEERQYRSAYQADHEDLSG
jgi:hypothetical protein